MAFLGAGGDSDEEEEKPPLAIGARYILEQPPVGKGAYGVVYRARDTTTGQM